MTALSSAALAELEDVLGERIATSPSVLDLHGRDESTFPPRRPAAVAMPRTTQEVASIVAACRRHGVPIIPFGTGSSLEGHVLPTRGGVSVDLSGMDQILDVSVADLDCRVQPGVRKRQLNDALGSHGLFFAVDPGADATLGGMAATGASGTMTVRYGTMRENVLGLEVVLADGTVVRTGSRARKSSAGYDLTRLLLGSEGTLGVITELILRLHGIPEHVAAARVSFPSIAAAVETAISTVQIGVPIARCELLDATVVRAVNAFAGLEEPEAPTLFLEFHGSQAGVDEQVETVEEISRGHGGSAFRFAIHAEERSRLWRARHEAYFAQLALRPGCRVVTTDVCVPVSLLAQCIEDTLADARPLPFPAPIVGHVADGNFHCGLMIDPDDEEELATARAFAGRLSRRAIALGGTCTGEHGVGLGKRDALLAQYGPEGIELMRAVKCALDPDGLMNPDKILGDPGAPQT
jgi:D-lactate dehydrogenase (cytochrome)